MKRFSHRFVPLTALLACLCAAPASAGEVEASGAAPVKITPATATLYNTTGITIGSYLYIYVQGDDNVEGGGDPNCLGTTGDRIIAYRALITNGVPGTFQRVGRISPKVKSPTKTTGFWPMSCLNPPASFGPGQVFQAKVNGVTKYHLLADVSDTFVFKTVWRAESTNGVSWTWYISGSANSSQTENLVRSDTGGAYTIQSVWSAQPFFQTTAGNILLLNPIVRSSAPATNNATWWGFFNYLDNFAAKVGAMQVVWSSGSPVIQVVTSTSPSWTYTSLSQGTLTISPAAVLAGANVKTLHQEGSQFQLWAGVAAGSYGTNVSCNTSNTVQCTATGGCATGDGSTVAYLASGRPFWLNTGPQGDVACPTCAGSGFAWWPVTSTSVGGMNMVYSHVRALPSGYSEARAFPFRWSSPTGNRYLFSTTNDDNICARFLFSPYLLMYVVRTTLVVE